MGNVRLVRHKVNQRNRAASKEQAKIRVLAIERMLQEGRKITAGEIQKRLELQYDIRVTQKTIYNDIAAIDRFIPIECTTGFGGGFKKCDFREVQDGQEVS